MRSLICLVYPVALVAAVERDGMIRRESYGVKADGESFVETSTSNNGDDGAAEQLAKAVETITETTVKSILRPHHATNGSPSDSTKTCKGHEEEEKANVHCCTKDGKGIGEQKGRMLFDHERDSTRGCIGEKTWVEAKNICEKFNDSSLCTYKEMKSNYVHSQ